LACIVLAFNSVASLCTPVAIVVRIATINYLDKVAPLNGDATLNLENKEQNENNVIFIINYFICCRLLSVI
jgi:hypothetical protein